MKNKKLYRIRLEDGQTPSIKEKEPDGFTNAEVRFFSKVLEEKHLLNAKDIKHILKNISINEWISTDHRIIYNDLKLGILTAIKHMRNDLSQISCDLQEKSKND